VGQAFSLPGFFLNIRRHTLLTIDNQPIERFFLRLRFGVFANKPGLIGPPFASTSA
jgi:hypothetical protein